MNCSWTKTTSAESESRLESEYKRKEKDEEQISDSEVGSTETVQKKLWNEVSLFF